MIWPLWVAVGIQLSPISFELEQGTSCMQLLPAALLMTQAAGPADAFCVQLNGRSVMFCLSLNGRITAKEAAKGFTEWASQSFACSEGHLSHGFLLPLYHVEAEGKVFFFCEMLEPGDSKGHWWCERQGNCTQFPKSV